MLSIADETYIAEHFWAYEHNWRFLRGYLGEPFLVGEYLAFSDGVTINIPAFALENRARCASSRDLEKVVQALPLRKSPGLVHIWGQFVASEVLVTKNGQSLPIADRDAVGESYTGEYTLDVEAHDVRRFPHAKEAVRSARVKALVADIRDINQLDHRHLELIEQWCLTRPVSVMAAAVTTSLTSYVREDHVKVIEIHDGSGCRGFSVVAVPAADHAVIIVSFPEKYPGARIGDSLLHAAIQHCKAHGCQTLHMGYAGSEAIARFKQKWGGDVTGPAYGQAVYATPGEWAARAAKFDFYWLSRLIEAASSR